jgi:alpha-D-xyloside xylohydrolase
MKNLFLIITSILFNLLLEIQLSAQVYERTALGVKASIESTDIEIQFYSPRIIRVIKSPAGLSFRKKSLSVIKQPENTPVAIVQKSNILLLNSSELCVMFNLLNGSVSFTGLDMRPLLSEKVGGSKFFSSTSSDAPHFSNSFALQQTFMLDKQEPVYGLGQHQNESMNQRGQSFLLEQANTKIAIPFFQSIKGYGLFWDNYSATQFTDNSKGTTFSSEAGDCIDYYFMQGDTMDGTIACLRELIGESPMYPLWSREVTSQTGSILRTLFMDFSGDN